MSAWTLKPDTALRPPRPALVEVQAKSRHRECLGRRPRGQHVLGDTENVVGAVLGGRRDEQRHGQKRCARIEQLSDNGPSGGVEEQFECDEEGYGGSRQSQNPDEQRINRRKDRIAVLRCGA